MRLLRMRNTGPPGLLISCNDRGKDPGEEGRGGLRGPEFSGICRCWSGRVLLALDLLNLPARDLEGP
jgi:hypothetical protein